MDLKLDLDFSGRNRPRTPFVNPRLAKRGSRWSVWHDTERNMGFFYGDEVEQKNLLLLNVWSHLGKNNTNASFTVIRSELNPPVDDDRRPINMREVDRSNAADIIQSLSDFRNQVQAEANRRHVIELTTRKMSFVFWEMSEDDCLAIRQSSKVSLMLEDVLNNSFFERLYLFVTCPNASWLPESVLKAFGRSLFSGPENTRICRKVLYPTLREGGRYDPKLRLLGVEFDGSDRLKIINPVTSDLSDWMRQQREDDERIDEQFRKFLNVLDDGSME